MADEPPIEKDPERARDDDARDSPRDSGDDLENDDDDDSSRVVEHRAKGYRPVGLAGLQPHRLANWNVKTGNGSIYSTVEDLYRLRALLERYAVECLAGRDLSALVASLDEGNSRMQAHFSARRIDAYLAENVAFHTLIIEASGNEPLRRTLAGLNEMAEPLRYALLARDFAKSRSVADHRRNGSPSGGSTTTTSAPAPARSFVA